MWYDETVLYQIYPLGFCGAPLQNDSVQTNRIKKVLEWIPHLKKMNVGAVLFNPVLESSSHGYDTRDLTKIDVRLGSNEDFALVCRQLHEAGIRVILDGVFNHVGREFWAFLDVLKNREGSQYKDWFNINFSGQSNYGDGLWYEGWEGHYELVKLNLHNGQLVDHLMDAVGGWIDDFNIDGIRLDVAYLLDAGFMRRLRSFVDGKKAGFFLVGEILGGDYKSIVAPDMLNSATNYECYKGLYSSFNSMNMFEIAYSLNRQFGPEDWTLYKGLNLLSFADNHDVTRVATVLEKPAHLPLLYTVMYTMPGIPCIYYGSEWGAQGGKRQGDPALRPAFDAPVDNELSAHVAKLGAVRSTAPALINGSYRQCYLTNGQFIFERKTEGQRILLAVNAADAEHTANFDAGAGTAKDLLSGKMADFGGGYRMPPLSAQILEMEK